MFQAIPCPSSGGQIVLLQHLVWSFSILCTSWERTAVQSAVNRCTE